MTPLEPAQVTIAVIGAGVRGRGFALACAKAGFCVVLEDVMPSNLRHAEQEFASLGHSVLLANTVEDAVRQADLAIDFMPDDLESKLEIYSMIDRMAPPRTVMLTPSQMLSITDLASCTYRPDRCVMLRGDLFAPSSMIQLLYPKDIAESTLELASLLITRLGYQVSAESDPDLPMLMKNMGYV